MMNTLMLVIVAVVAFVYFGGSNVPSVLRKNKELLLGVVIGLFLCSFMGLRLEGIHVDGAEHTDSLFLNCLSDARQEEAENQEAAVRQCMVDQTARDDNVVVPAG